MTGEARKFVEDFYKTSMPQNLLFHNFQHVRDVLRHGLKIGKGSGLQKADLECLEIAILFHDIAYDSGREGHEKRGAEKAVGFLRSGNYPEDQIEKIASIIRCTEPGSIPTNLLQRCMKDADSAHVGTKSFQAKANLLRAEWELTAKTTYRDEDWAREQIAFLLAHQFHTEFAAYKYGQRKIRNLVIYQEQIRLVNSTAATGKPGLQDVIEELSWLKEKVLKPDRGIEAMFQIINNNHMELSSMADNKANIMISVNAIVISIIVSVLAPNFDSHPFLILPSLLFVASSLFTIIFSILATRPKISGGMFTREDVKNKKANLLFFGNFHRMKFDDFHYGMNELLQNRDLLHNNMIRDFFFLGIVLGKKYRLVRLAYNFFMYGLILSILAFTVSYFIFDRISNL